MRQHSQQSHVRGVVKLASGQGLEVITVPLVSLASDGGGTAASGWRPRQTTIVSVNCILLVSGTRDAIQLVRYNTATTRLYYYVNLLRVTGGVVYPGDVCTVENRLREVNWRVVLD